ncbi:MAG: hypothetical protein U9O98_09680, partial [Asgard group archaeon]|nr:hypothetical protein [Asgard group archaeon]
MKNINKLKILIVFIILNLLSINSFIKAETSPIIDNSNDVNRFVDDVFVDKGDYHDEIDFYFLDFSADNVTVTFAETPSLDTVSYGYKITIIWTHVNEGENYTEIKTGYLTEGFGTSSVFTILQDSNGTIIDTCGTIDTVYLSDKQLITPINTTGIADPSNAYNVTATSNFITNENSQSVL